MSILNTTTSYNHSKTKTEFPISVSEAKKHLRIDTSFTDDDNYIAELIESATTIAENYINKDIAKTENNLKLHEYSSNYFKVYEGNFHSLISITDGEDNPIGEVDYTLIHPNSFSVFLEETISAKIINLNFYTGYDISNCPKVIKQAIKIIIADLYDSQRSNYNWSGMSNNHVWENLLTNYIQIRF